MLKKEKVASLLLRIGLAIVFCYAGVAGFLDPQSWIGYFPVFLREMIAPAILLPVFSSTEIVLALWLLSGRGSFLAGCASAILMLGIITFNTSLLDIVFRDIAIFFTSIAVAYLSTEDTSTF